MESKELTLHVGESRELQLASRGASGLQLLFSVDPADVVSVTRRETTSPERDSLRLTAGDAIPAFFTLAGTKSGKATVYFYEKPAGSRSGPEIPVITYQVRVAE